MILNINASKIYALFDFDNDKEKMGENYDRVKRESGERKLRKMKRDNIKI